MHIFTDYVQPLASWLHTNPSWALLFTFAISCTESLAIIGSIIPGSLTMTAIGMLAGSGVMRIDLTLCSASLGALVGDGISYMLGYIFSDRLTQIWPFKRYPNLLRYGNDFFVRHGGKSVLIGRFVGPLRSIIPVIAGMMHMPRSHFFLANLFSAIGWAILYIIPGYLIGTASSQLSSDSARRLFGFIIILLLTVWIASKGIHWLARSINRWYNGHLITLYKWSKNNKYFKRLFKDLAAEERKNINSVTITLLFTSILCILVSGLITLFVIQDTWVNLINSPISFFLQSLRTQLFDGFFIILNFIISPISLLGFFILISIAAISARDWRMLGYWVSLTGITVGLTWLLSSNIAIPNPDNLYTLKSNATFPVIQLTWGTALFSFIMCYLMEYHRNELSSLLRAFLTTLLILAGFSTIYFGDNWMTSVLAAYFIGLTIGLMHWIFYQRQTVPQHRVILVIILSGCLLMITTGIEYVMDFQTIKINHASKPQQYELTEDAWWSQSKPILPIYTTNRIGRNIGLFNIQYAGSLRHLEQRLSKYGWKKQSNSFLYSLLIRVGGQHAAEDWPVMEQLYLNKKPILIMTYHAIKNNNIYILRLWRSNFHISNYQDPIWLGSIILARKKTDTMFRSTNTSNQSATLFSPMFQAINHYRITNIMVKDPRLKSLRYVIPPELLIIKEQQ